MITMHADLRDRAARRGRGLTVGILIASTISAVLAFSGTEEKIRLLMFEASSSVWLGVLGTAVFIASLIDLVLNHRGVADQHSNAVGRLSELKLEYGSFSQAPAEEKHQALKYLQQRYSEVMSTIAPIPEAEFNRLKAKHLRKVEISKILSKFPGESVRGAERRLKSRLKEQPTNEGPPGSGS
ncbi:hypothetical protein OCL88_18835 [Paenarthrobacter sp. PAE-2]|uniref:hypothetical protein n=1 Tax=Paenarthrobacter sp. PAE-2 TaxID=2982532 RepID=UPI0022322077|nr:hypothetical protein [Paenarthrobacter sp. PAE-2]MCW3768537.1 hypothetical protein [Paenarthrobacter sp. PAE-2]